MADETTKLEFHPYANIFPLVEEGSREWLNLVESLKIRVYTPVWLYQGMILDGRTRYSIAQKYPDIKLEFQEFSGNDEEALEFSKSMNNDRRNLDESQRALVAIRYWYHVKNSGHKVTNDDLVKMFNVGKSLIALAHKINGSDIQEKHELLGPILRGELPVTRAYDYFENLAPEKWKDAALNKDKAREYLKQAKADRIIDHSKTKQGQEAAEIRKAANNAHANGETIKFGVLLIDPPVNMSNDAIRSLEIPAADNSIVFLWSQSCSIADRIEILQGWGFSYVHTYVWYIKENNEAEFLLLGYKGSGVNLVEPKMPTAQQATVGKSGGRPAIFKNGIATMTAAFNKFDMFGKGKDDQVWFHGGNPVEEPKERKARPARKAKKSKETQGEQPAPTND